MLIPYNDPQYHERRPTIAIPAANVLQIGSDRAGIALGLHPRLTGLRTIFNAGRLAFIQRTGYRQLQPFAFRRNRHLVDRRSAIAAGQRLARPLSRYAALACRSADRLVHRRRDSADAAGEPRRRAVHSERCRAMRSPARTAARTTQFARDSATRIASHLPVDQPHLAFVNATAQAAFATLDRVAQVGTYVADA